MAKKKRMPVIRLATLDARHRTYYRRADAWRKQDWVTDDDRHRAEIDGLWGVIWDLITVIQNCADNGCEACQRGMISIWADRGQVGVWDESHPWPREVLRIEDCLIRPWGEWFFKTFPDYLDVKCPRCNKTVGFTRKNPAPTGPSYFSCEDCRHSWDIHAGIDPAEMNANRERVFGELASKHRPTDERQADNAVDGLKDAPDAS